jgi:ubiquinone/menaquinone biosynthesis C-methylase UbiE
VSYVYMKVLESAPGRYDRGMRLLTLGRLERLYEDIAAQLTSGERVLDVGCGTGALAVRLARQGCSIIGIDISPRMLAQAAERVRAEGMESQVVFQELGAVDLDTAFPDASFDVVVSTLVFSELSEDEIEYTLQEIGRILRPKGKLMVADEVMPDSALRRVGTLLFRLPFAVLAYLLTQNTTHRVAGLRERIEHAGYRIVDIGNYLAGTLKLFIAEKVQ